MYSFFDSFIRIRILQNLYTVMAPSMSLTSSWSIFIGGEQCHGVGGASRPKRRWPRPPNRRRSLQ